MAGVPSGDAGLPVAAKVGQAPFVIAEKINQVHKPRRVGLGEVGLQLGVDFQRPFVYAHPRPVGGVGPEFAQDDVR